MYRIIATTSFGLESIVKREAIDLGFTGITVSDGAVEFEGGFEEIARANLQFRCADKIMLVLGRFKAASFEELFDGVYGINWQDILEKNANFIINGKSVRSTLSSVPAVQSVAEKAVIKKLQTKYSIERFPKTGSTYSLLVSVLKDEVTVSLNTSGGSLHKRGYRAAQVLAPLKETMAAALVKLSYWNKDRILLDPCCGSGTIAIEAAMIAKNIAPGLFRTFDSEKHSCIPASVWKDERAKARGAIVQECVPTIYASDINAHAVEIAASNAEKACVEDCIRFEQIPFNKLTLPGKYGVCIANPPYSERMGDLKDTERLYRDMGRLFKQDPTWSVYIITSHEGFEKLYGKKADKKRKLYNGNVKTDYYQFYGLRPPKKTGESND